LGQRVVQLPHEHADVACSGPRALHARRRVQPDPVARDGQPGDIYPPLEADAPLPDGKACSIALVASSLTTKSIDTEAPLCSASGSASTVMAMPDASPRRLTLRLAAISPR
jgi:hypothetical protein